MLWIGKSESENIKRVVDRKSFLLRNNDDDRLVKINFVFNALAHCLLVFILHTNMIKINTIMIIMIMIMMIMIKICTQMSID